MSREWCSVTEGMIRLSVQVMPNAKNNEVVGLIDGALKIRLQAQPIEGKANDALIRYLADLLDIPKSAIAITQGHTGKRKTLKLDTPDLRVEFVQRKLLPASCAT
jgi:uncharacterized protein (TIGR00251 family)